MACNQRCGIFGIGRALDSAIPTVHSFSLPRDRQRRFSTTTCSNAGGQPAAAKHSVSDGRSRAPAGHGPQLKELPGSSRLAFWSRFRAAFSFAFGLGGFQKLTDREMGGPACWLAKYLCQSRASTDATDRKNPTDQGWVFNLVGPLGLEPRTNGL